MHTTLFAWTAILALTGPQLPSTDAALVAQVAAGQQPRGSQGAPGSTPGVAHVSECVISPKKKADVSAEEAGMLKELKIVEGSLVELDEWLGKLDDTQARMQLVVTEMEKKAAEEQSDSDVNERFAVASKNVARSEYEQAEIANRKVAGAVSQAEVRRRAFALQRATLQIEQAQLEGRVEDLTVQTREAEVEAAKASIDRRQIVAPFGGMVVEVFRQQGEWLQPGDPLYRIMQLDSMHVEGFLSASDYLPSEVDGKQVELVAEIKAGLTVTFPGKVVFVSPEVDPISRLFRFKAEVQNKRSGNHYLLRPGLRAQMKVFLNGDAPRVGKLEN